MTRKLNKSHLSANTLFHYTDTIEKLLSILKNEFYPRYCLEEGLNIIYDDVYDMEIGIPMVCFCDIPLSQIQQHVQTYGRYAIGLSKKWGIRKKINPVMYSYQQAGTSDNIYNLWKIVLNQKGSERGVRTYDIAPLLFNLKPYKGVLWKNGKKGNKEIIFYNEREWRFVPYLKTNKNMPVNKRQFINKHQYLNNDQRKKLNKLLENDDTKLKFGPNDIKYIIVNEESERSEIRNQIINIKGGKFNQNEIEVLTTRILSIDQIMEDF